MYHDSVANVSNDFRSYYNKGSFDTIYGRLIHTGDSEGLVIESINNSSNQSIVFKSGASDATTTERMRILTGGNVGIGTAGPDRKLDILDAANPQLRLSHTDGSVYADMQVDGNGYLILDPTGDRVGIGTSSPDQALTVVGNIACKGTVTTTSSFYAYTTTGSGLGILYNSGTASDNRLTMRSNGTDLLTANGDSGKVGILTNFPSVALSVNSTSIQIVTSSTYTALQACVKGSIAYDEEYLYVCSTAGMKRVTLGAGW
jgi:hypothetical protein